MPGPSNDPLEHLPREFRPEVILEALNDHGVHYVVVGGMAAVLHGAEVSTIDLDVVIEQSRANRDRAVDALWSIGAERITYTRDVAGAGEPVPENGDGLVEPIESFRTRDGTVDLLREALVIGGYNDLSEKAQVFFVEDQEVYVADLDAVITAKEASSEIKDQLHLRSLYDLRNALEAEEAADRLAGQLDDEGVTRERTAEPDPVAEIRASNKRIEHALADLTNQQAPEEHGQGASEREQSPEHGPDHNL